jgi:plastocyanin
MKAAQRSMQSRIALAGALGLLCIGGGLGVSGAAAEKAATHTVVIEGVKFEPETLTVARGDTVVWVNKDPFAHTVTAKGFFDSHDLPAGKSWKYVASKTGEYAYVCNYHPNMHGTLTVK